MHSVQLSEKGNIFGTLVMSLQSLCGFLMPSGAEDSADVITQGF